MKTVTAELNSKTGQETVVFTRRTLLQESSQIGSHNEACRQTRRRSSPHFSTNLCIQTNKASLTNNNLINPQNWLPANADQKENCETKQVATWNSQLEEVWNDPTKKSTVTLANKNHKTAFKLPNQTWRLWNSNVQESNVKESQCSLKFADERAKANEGLTPDSRQRTRRLPTKEVCRSETRKPNRNKITRIPNRDKLKEGAKAVAQSWARSNNTGKNT